MTDTNICSNFGGFRCGPPFVDSLYSDLECVQTISYLLIHVFSAVLWLNVTSWRRTMDRCCCFMGVVVIKKRWDLEFMIHIL